MSEDALLTLDLPYPPTIGTYWGHRVIASPGRKPRVHMFIKEQGTAFREYVVDLAAESGHPKILPKDGQLIWMRVVAYPPDRRKRDLDNISKALLDALQNAGLFADDYLIGRIEAERLGKVPGGRCVVSLGVYDTGG